MIKIGDKECRTMQEQVYENMDEIDKLKEVIKPMYKATTSLNSSSTTILISSTNAPDGTKSGWLIDTGGLLFKITGGDETSLLITYYSDLRGPQGESGAAVNIDDTGTSLTKVWSSKKVSDTIDLIRDKGIYYTLVQPTLDNGEYILNVSDLGNNNTYTWQKYGDLIIYIDGNGNPTELWKCVSLNGTHDIMTVEKIADYAKGKQLYQHNVSIKLYDNNMQQTDFVISFKINNADSEAFNYTKFKTLILDTLGENSQRTIDNGFFAVNGFYQNNANYKIEGIVTGNNALAWTNDTMWIMYSNSNNITYANIPLENNTRYTFTFKDDPKLL